MLTETKIVREKRVICRYLGGRDANHREHSKSTPPSLERAGTDSLFTLRVGPLSSNARSHTQVMVRNNYRCFMSGGLDSRAYYAGRPIPTGARIVFCLTVPIISPEVWTHDSPAEAANFGRTRFVTLDSPTVRTLTLSGIRLPSRRSRHSES